MTKQSVKPIQGAKSTEPKIATKITLACDLNRSRLSFLFTHSRAMNLTNCLSAASASLLRLPFCARDRHTTTRLPTNYSCVMKMNRPKFGARNRRSLFVRYDTHDMAPKSPRGGRENKGNQRQSDLHILHLISQHPKMKNADRKWKCYGKRHAFARQVLKGLRNP